MAFALDSRSLIWSKRTLWHAIRVPLSKIRQATEYFRRHFSSKHPLAEHTVRVSVPNNKRFDDPLGLAAARVGRSGHTTDRLHIVRAWTRYSRRSRTRAGENFNLSERSGQARSDMGPKVGPVLVRIFRVARCPIDHVTKNVAYRRVMRYSHRTVDARQLPR
jgi:hypothetical protein